MVERRESVPPVERARSQRARASRWVLASAVLFGSFVVVLAGGCQSDPVPTGPCNQHPFDCGANETCWPNASSTGFACMAAGVGKQGDACQLVPAQPSCGPHLLCLMPAGTTTGTCTTYCETIGDAHGCPTGLSCSIFTLGSGGAELAACAAATGTSSASTGTGG